MKKVTAKINIEALCVCPHCGSIIDVIESVQDFLEVGLMASGLTEIIDCLDCNKEFIVDNVS